MIVRQYGDSQILCIRLYLNSVKLFETHGVLSENIA